MITRGVRAVVRVPVVQRVINIGRIFRNFCVFRAAISVLQQESPQMKIEKNN